jgi:hypothetical protein
VGQFVALAHLAGMLVLAAVVLVGLVAVDLHDFVNRRARG